MQRRSFVGLLGASASGLGASACRQAGEAEAPGLADEEFAADMDRLDRGLRRLECAPIAARDLALRAANGPVVCREEDPLDERLLRSSLRALLLTGTVKDLPARDRARPEVQARLDAAAPEVDFAVYGMTERMSRMSAEEMTRVQATLREDPEVADRIAAMIEEEAAAADVPLHRRLRLRRLVSRAIWRLKHQPMSLFVEEYAGKVRRYNAQLLRSLEGAPVVAPAPEEVARWEAQTLRVVERYADPAAAGVDEARARADALIRHASEISRSEPMRAAAEYEQAAVMYAKAAYRLPETPENRALRDALLAAAVPAFLRAHRMAPRNVMPLLAAYNMLRTHEAQLRAAYGEAATGLPEHQRIVQRLREVDVELARFHEQERAPTRANAAEDEARRASGRMVLRAGGIVLGVGVGLLALGLGLLFTITLAGAFIATAAGVLILGGIITMVVGAIRKQS